MKNILTMGADPTGAVDATPIIRAAIASGEGVYMPAGRYRISDWDGPANVFMVTKPAPIIGDGAATVLVLDASMPAGMNLFHVAPDPSYWPRGFDFRHFQIRPATPGLGGSAIFYDTLAAGAQLAGSVVEDLQIWQMGGQAIASAANNLNGPWSLKIRDNLLQGGISLTKAGDTIHIEDNDITGTGVGIAATFAPGAAAMTIKGNNITSQGGSIWLYGAIGAVIEENECEVSSAGYNGPTGALVCIQNSSSNTLNKNKINASTLTACLRLIGSNGNQISRSFYTAAHPFWHVSDQQPPGVNQWFDNEYIDGVTGAAVSGGYTVTSQP